MKTRFALALAVALSAGAAGAQEVMVSDVRCVVAFSALLKNPQYAEGAATGLFFFLGRIEGRDASYDLGQAVRYHMSHMSPGQIGDEARRCGAVVRERNEALKGIGQSLRPRGVGR